MTALAIGADGSRLYAGSYAGVWRSDDGGQSWRQLTWPQPNEGAPPAEIAGALFAPHIYDVATSPTDADVVLVSAGDSQFLDKRDGIYRSADGGATWTLVYKTTAASNLVFAPDDAELVFAAMGWQIGVSDNGGVTWTVQPLSGASHVAVGPAEAGGIRRVYAAGSSAIWYSTDSGTTWSADAGAATILAARKVVNDFQKTCDPKAGVGGFAGGIAYAGGTAGQILAVEPGQPTRVYLATEGAANGPSFYNGNVPDGTACNTMCGRLAGEGSLWVGDFSQFDQVSNATAQWEWLPGPPVYYGNTSPSGNIFLKTKPSSNGFLLFFSDSSHVHVSQGVPTANGWHRLDGEDVSAAQAAGHHSNYLFVHPDPHGLVFTSDFDITLAPANAYNSVISAYSGGTIWMANDGGVNWNDSGGQDQGSWKWPIGLETLDAVNLAGLTGLGTKPALYFGSGDNNDFFSRDGGASWQDPGSGCGDCDAWFSDPAQADRVMLFLPRSGSGDVAVIRSSDPGQYPDASDGGSKTYIPSTKARVAGPPPALVPYASSGIVLRGYRPVIKTLATEAPLADGDYVFIDQALDTGIATLLRTTAISSITTAADWADTSKASPIGPPSGLPMGANVVQVSGGHAAPVYFVADPYGSVWRLDFHVTGWDQIVPHSTMSGTPVFGALRWYVDPYDPRIVYVLDWQGVKVSANGGEDWMFDPGLTSAVTAGGALAISASLLQDFQFFRGERQTRFALGTAGVFCTMDSGVSWFPVLNSLALPGRPESAFFDPLSDQTDRALYVECEGRSILRIGGIPELPPFTPPVPFDLMMLAALDQ